MGNAHPNLVPYQVFQAADGPLIVATGNDRQCWDFCRMIGRADLAEDPRYRANADRIRNRGAFISALAEAVARMPRAKLLAALEAAAVPAGPINTVGRNFRRPAGRRPQDAARCAGDRRARRQRAHGAVPDPPRRRGLRRRDRRPAGSANTAPRF